MPTMTQIVRNGEPVPLRWGGWHLDMIEEATGRHLWHMDGFVVEHDFAVCDRSDREEFFLYKGDVLRAWYSSRG